MFRLVTEGKDWDMLSLLIALAAAPAAQSQAAIDQSRRALVACLKTAAAEGKPPEVTTGSFGVWAKTRCAAGASALQGSMVAFDMKNGSSRKSANEGAQMAVDDYVESARNTFSNRQP